MSLKGIHCGLVKFFLGADIVQISPENASFFKYSTHYLTRTLVLKLRSNTSNDRGDSRTICSPFLFCFYKYTTRRSTNTSHYYIRMNLITSGYIKKHFLSVVTPAFSLCFSLCLLTHSVVFIQTCV